ncbi:hypothetical protein [Dethiosulfatarculus sandiegensis]|jgi:hypothetical protein|uniref:Uncharacterized protein n=1 Tax=Dethiosulfatarculus sandiegensis TaxID=1429043 RepID=A0A0D2HKR9_9BACT|nr:hypothetical protein [Dethiosulfatarculus sandiegensis]KIX11253.1 hypothetical protein X474_26005 [Dethiosulfatarculus sandiegensis]
MARQSKWNIDDRKKLMKMVREGIAEQDIRRELAIGGVPMTAVEFAQQLKMAMVEAGQIKQASRKKSASSPKAYEVTNKGRLTITDFTALTGYETGATFTLEKPRGKSKAWRLVLVSED